MLKIQLCITEINNILKYIKIEKSYFNLQPYFIILKYFLSNKCNLGEHKIILKW